MTHLSIELFSFSLCRPGFISLRTAFTLQQTCRTMLTLLSHLRKSQAWRERSASRIQRFIRKNRREEIRSMLYGHIADIMQHVHLPADAYSTVYLRLWKRSFMVWPYAYSYPCQTPIKCEIQIDSHGRIVYIWHFKADSIRGAVLGQLAPFLGGSSDH